MKKILIIGFLLTLTMHFSYGQRYVARNMKEISRTGWTLAPVPYDSGLVYLSNRIIPAMRGERTSLGYSPMKLYYVPLDENNRAQNSGELFMDFYEEGEVGPITFARRGRIACYVVSYATAEGLKNNTFSGLYFKTNRNGEWTEREAFEHNDPAVNFSTPFLTEDGRYLYFAAAGLEENKENWDIYVCRSVNGEWSEPENLGPEINTDTLELFPFLHQESGRLYFSSRGHNARGGSLDLFFSTNYRGKWTQPIQLPSPLNSINDDYSLFINENFSKGLISRKYTGGRQQDADILSFEYPNYQPIDNAQAIKRNRFCFRIRENSLDTIDYETFSYEWVINDTLVLPGHDVKYCFPGPGEYRIQFNVTNKLIDTVMYGVAKLYQKLELKEQPVITCRDTSYVDQPILFNSNETYLPGWRIEGYYWDFDNGVQDKGESVNYIYPLPGEYRVKLEVRGEEPDDDDEDNKNAQRREQRIKYKPAKSAVYKDIIVLPKE